MQISYLPDRANFKLKFLKSALGHSSHNMYLITHPANMNGAESVGLVCGGTQTMRQRVSALRGATRWCCEGCGDRSKNTYGQVFLR